MLTHAWKLESPNTHQAISKQVTCPPHLEITWGWFETWGWTMQARITTSETWLEAYRSKKLNAKFEKGETWTWNIASQCWKWHLQEAGVYWHLFYNDKNRVIGNCLTMHDKDTDANTKLGCFPSPQVADCCWLQCGQSISTRMAIVPDMKEQETPSPGRGDERGKGCEFLKDKRGRQLGMRQQKQVGPVLAWTRKVKS